MEFGVWAPQALASPEAHSIGGRRLLYLRACAERQRSQRAFELWVCGGTAVAAASAGNVPVALAALVAASVDVVRTHRAAGAAKLASEAYWIDPARLLPRTSLAAAAALYLLTPSIGFLDLLLVPTCALAAGAGALEVTAVLLAWHAFRVSRWHHSPVPYDADEYARRWANELSQPVCKKPTG